MLLETLRDIFDWVLFDCVEFAGAEMGLIPSDVMKEDCNLHRPVRSAVEEAEKTTAEESIEKLIIIALVVVAWFFFLLDRIVFRLSMRESTLYCCLELDLVLCHW